MAELNDFMADFEAERLAEIERDEARRNTPEAIAAREAKKRAEHEKGVRLGWWDEEGNSLIAETDDGADEEAEDEE
jgi:hypothetical protein